jgi:uncharacterized membrane protein YkvA (DUF1232 family)
MPINISFQLTDTDLEYFRKAMREVRANAHSRDEQFIISAAARLVKETGQREMPEFVRERLAKLEGLIRMLEDVEWRLEGDHRARVLGAIAYFAEPKDLVPDQIPGLGFLDDAIMVELVVRELEHEIDSYADFCHYRDEQKHLEDADPELRRERLEKRRKAMYARMDARRERRARRGGSLFRIF